MVELPHAPTQRPALADVLEATLADGCEVAFLRTSSAVQPAHHIAQHSRPHCRLPMPTVLHRHTQSSGYGERCTCPDPAQHPGQDRPRPWRKRNVSAAGTKQIDQSENIRNPTPKEVASGLESRKSNGRGFSQTLRGGQTDMWSTLSSLSCPCHLSEGRRKGVAHKLLSLQEMLFACIEVCSQPRAFADGWKAQNVSPSSKDIMLQRSSPIISFAPASPLSWRAAQ